MDAEVEQLVGQRAWLIYGESLGAILENVLSSYKRAGGFDELTRFHGSTAGYDVLMLLKRALRQQGHARGYQVEESFVEIRYRLRTYLGELCSARSCRSIRARRRCGMHCSRWISGRDGF